MFPPASPRQVIDKRPFGAFQCRVLGLCFVVALFDGFDTQAIAFTGPALLAAFGLQPGALAPVLVAGVLGMAIGAMALGWLGDRYGRRPTVMGAVLLFSSATLATALSHDLNQILILRFLAGIGMGGATPVMLALVSEYVATRHRGAAVTGILLGLPAGAMLGGLLASHFMAALGWQGIFVIGGLAPMLLLILMAARLPESADYLLARQGSAAAPRIARVLNIASATAEGFRPEEKAGRTGVAALFAPGLARTTVMVWLTYLLNWVAWFMLLSWMPTVLKQGGLDAAQAPMATVTVNAAFILFALGLAIALPRLDARRLLIGLFVLGIAACLGMSWAGTQWAMMFVCIALAGVGVGGQQLALNYLVVSAYPTALRATATGWAIGMGRVGAIIGSALGGWALSTFAVSGFFLALVAPLAVGLLAVLGVRLAAGPAAAGPAAAVAPPAAGR